MPVYKFIREYLNFSRRDRIGVIAVLVLTMAVYFLPLLFPREKPGFPPEPVSILEKAMDSLESRPTAIKNEKERIPGNFNRPTVSDYSKGELFSFDPNTLSPEGWARLGLEQRTITTISRFCNKGGKFYRAEDLQKIWGLPRGFYERVKKYIIIPSATERTATTVNYPQKTQHFEKVVEKVSINDADTSRFINLPGIGSKLASRIVSFREKLGGFYSVDQVAEIYGLKDSTFQKIKPYLEINGPVKKIPLNTVTKEELKVHPYFKWALANAIIEYRSQHGSFKSLEELKNISLIDEGTFNKIVHYLEL